MLNPWFGVSFVIIVLAGSMAGLSLCQRRCGLHPETARKVLHVGMGLVTLGFPWLFMKAWPVLLLAVISIGGFVVFRMFGSLQRYIGSVLHSVARLSFGEIYFVLGVCCVYLFSAGDALLYCIPISILTLADAGAGLIGESYGRERYVIGKGHKSFAGSITFFVIAYLCTDIPLLVFTGAAHGEAALIAVLTALSTTALEACAHRGLDNLLIPVGAFVVLKVCIDLEAPALAAGLVVVVVLIVWAMWWLERYPKMRCDDEPIHRD